MPVIQLFLIVSMLCSGAVSAKRRAWVGAVQEKSVKKPSERLLDRLLYAQMPTDASLEHLMEKTEESIKNVKNSAFNREKCLYQDASSKVEKLRQEADEQTRHIFEHLSSQVASIQEATTNDSQELRQEAVQKILGLIEQAEHRALALKRQHRARIAARELEEQKARRGENRLTSEHKQNLMRQWRRVNEFVQSIIMAGESETERKDFQQRFAQQQRWFAATLATTHATNDPAYMSLLAKKRSLDLLASAQERADRLLGRLAQEMTLAPGLVGRIRLAILYELYHLLAQNSSDAQAISAADIDAIVHKHVVKDSGLSLAYTGPGSDTGVVDLKATGVLSPTKILKHARAAKRQEALKAAQRESLIFAEKLTQAEEKFKHCMQLLEQAKQQQAKDRGEILELKTQLHGLQQQVPMLHKKLTDLKHMHAQQTQAYKMKIDQLHHSLDSTVSTAHDFMQAHQNELQKGQEMYRRERAARAAQAKDAQIKQQLNEQEKKEAQRIIAQTQSQIEEIKTQTQNQVEELKRVYEHQQKMYQQQAKQLQHSLDTTVSTAHELMQAQRAEIQRERAYQQKRAKRKIEDKDDRIKELVELANRREEQVARRQEHDQQMQMQVFMQQQALQSAWQNRLQELERSLGKAQGDLSTLSKRIADQEQRHAQELAAGLAMVDRVEQHKHEELEQSKIISNDLKNRLHITNELLEHATATYRQALLPTQKSAAKASDQKMTHMNDYQKLEAELAAWPEK